MKSIVTFIFIFSISNLIFAQSNIRIKHLNNGSCAYFDNETQKMVTREFDHCYEPQHNKLVAGNREKGMGLYDVSGKELLPQIYSRINVFEKYNLVTEFSKKMFITRNDGTKLHEGSFDNIASSYSSQNFIARSGSFYHLMDSTGTFQLTNNFDSLYFTSSKHVYGFMKGGKQGMINTTGHIVHTPLLDAINKVSGDSVLVKLEGKWLTFTQSDSAYHDIILNDPFPESWPLYKDLDMSKGKKLTTFKAKRGASESQMLEFLYRNLKYPSYARMNRIQGQVVIRFTINVDGTTSDFETLSGPDQSLADAAIDVIKQMVFEKPAMFNGQYVKSKYTLPVKFSLQE